MTARNGAERREGGSAAQRDAQLGRSIVHALRNTGTSILYQDRNLRIVWAHNVPAAWGAEIRPGAGDDAFLPAAEAQRLTAAKTAVIESGRPDSLEIAISAEDGVRWFDVWINADRGSDESVQGVVTTAVEITDRKRREQTLKALLREVSHRSKNLLAIIQSIATQTGRYSGTIDEFLARFAGRLQSLASSQDLVTSSNWRGADLRELIASQVGRYTADPARRIRFDGENPYLNPNAALHIGLALHELAVNSVSFGALSRPDGSVAIATRLDAVPPARKALVLVWTERVPRDGREAAEKRFGSAALERVVPTSLNGSAALTIADGELRYDLVVPDGNFEIE
jgi:two-component sensor histidine kinase